MDGLTLHHVRDLSDYWASCPPVHVMLASFFGLNQSRATAPALLSSESEIRSLLAMFGQALPEE